MTTLTQADVMWLGRLLVVIEYIYEHYPELFTKEDEETLKIARQLIEEIQP